MNGLRISFIIVVAPKTSIWRAMIRSGPHKRQLKRRQMQLKRRQMQLDNSVHPHLKSFLTEANLHQNLPSLHVSKFTSLY